MILKTPLDFYYSDVKCVCGLRKCDFRGLHLQEVINFNKPKPPISYTNFGHQCPICTTGRGSGDVVCWPCWDEMVDGSSDDDRSTDITYLFEQMAIFAGRHPGELI